MHVIKSNKMECMMGREFSSSKKKKRKEKELMVLSKKTKQLI